jgi:hypothetical protein
MTQEHAIYTAYYDASEAIARLDWILRVAGPIGDYHEAVGRIRDRLSVACTRINESPENTDWDGPAGPLVDAVMMLNHALTSPAAARAHIEQARDVLAALKLKGGAS